MNDQLLNGFNNKHDVSNGGQPSIKFQFVDKSKTLQARHEQIKADIIKVIDAMALLEDQYNNLQQELYSIEQEYIKNLQNIVD